MLTRITLVFTLCALISACSGPQIQERVPEGKDVPAAATGPLTVQSSDGVEIAATVHSLGTPTLVLIHGWMCDQSYWENQIPALAESFGIITVDLAGHGLSGSDRQNWTIASLGGDVAAVISHLQLENVVLIGHSMGGRVALEVARLLPGTIIGIIGVDTLQDAEQAWDPGQAEAMLAGFERDFRGACEAFVRSMFGEEADLGLIDRITADMCGGPGEIGAALLRDYVGYDLPAAFQNAGVPIRCVNSDKWPSNIEGNRQYADYDAVILKGYGHFLMQEAPEALNSALIETIRSLSAGPETGVGH